MTPKTEQELADAIASAKGPLHITGGGTRPIGNPVVGEGLSTSGLSGITLYEPGALTIVAQAGTPVAEIEAALDSENQRLAFEPMDHRALLGTSGAPTIGGVVAGNVSGSRRIAVGACRDHALGVRFVDGAGEITKNGGRVMKNVTGYDLVKLMCGSFGTLGVLSEVSLKVLPKPETSATLTLHGLSVAQSVEAMSAALGSPFEVTGAARTHDTHIRIEGFAASVAYRLEKLKDLLSGYGEISVTEDANLWAGITNVTGFAKTDSDIWRVSIKPSDAPALIAALPDTCETSLDWGGGLIWVATPAGTDLRATMAVDGHATLVRASTQTRAALPVFHPENPTVTALSQGLRAKFDPRGILNAGLMG
ncbi:FAD-binding protein [Octadecabacter sp. G9-8]|uniref:FAD-binding protein n=1 Tax=Octadecabacter dasysiphoniae TaxID=2909341 RepID=A0ABS9CXB2_9RHOB|nr:FAD-binding protein [Octadecabacter dasysiphoniae]MCF2871020.1 FAD-binding protein [Octadecabacter dasysiphoniae]